MAKAQLMTGSLKAESESASSKKAISTAAAALAAILK